MADDVADQQRWLDRRLDGLEPGDFAHHGGALMVAPQHLVPPQRFAQGWLSLPEPGQAQRLQDAQVEGTAAIVVFADPGSEVEVNAVCEFVTAIERTNHTPPVFWAPHSVEPERRRRGSSASARRLRSLDAVMGAGADAVIAAEPEGWCLTVAVRTSVMKATADAASLNGILNRRREASQEMDYLQRCNEATLWDYLRVRCADCIPPMDVSIPGGEVTEIDGYSVGRLLGEGMSGKVYMLDRSGGEEDEARPGDTWHRPGAQQVLKAVPKGKATSLSDLKCMKRTIDVMRLLSSETWKHENIVQLYSIYHSRTHILFRMECGGPMDLFRRLVLRQRSFLDSHRLPFDRAASLLSQTIGVIAFLQLGPRVCHRDIKPENVTIRETEDALTMKLCDFDLACVQRSPRAMCSCPCGTYPFFAPEVLLAKEYGGLTADVWSLGVLLLEIICRARFLERTLNLPTDGDLHSDHKDVGRRITAFFEPPGAVADMLGGAVREELLPLQPLLLDGIRGMLALAPQDRTRAERLLLLSRDVLKVRGAARNQSS